MLLRSDNSFRLPIVISGLIFCLLFTVVFSGCSKSKTQDSQGQIIKTWDLLGEKIPPIIFSPRLEELPPEKSLVWAGTVSHHLLADQPIDNWFREIARRRKVETFFVICPSHYGLSTEEWSLDNCRWQTANGMVYTNEAAEEAIAKALEVRYDPQVFPPEHGVNALIPYISKYFPKAKVCVIAVFGEPPLNQKNAQKLADAMAPYFTDAEKKKNFLLISTDFAHHGDYEGTVFKDNRSREFFKNPSDSTWVFCGCDNRPGIYVLSRFLSPKTKNAVLYHTNSFELSGQDGNDITSYFFSLFYD